MNTQQKTKKTSTKSKPWYFWAMLATGGMALLIAGWMVFNYFRNYAAETARPLEAALVKAGAVKQCSRGDTGRGWSDSRPDYKAIYEVPGNRDEATDLVQAAAKEAGFSLSSESAPSGAKNNSFYSDRSKLNSYNALEASNISLIFTIFGSSTRAEGDDPFCTVQDKGKDSPRDRTTIDFTINMPEFKR